MIMKMRFLKIMMMIIMIFHDDDDLPPPATLTQMLASKTDVKKEKDGENSDHDVLN